MTVPRSEVTADSLLEAARAATGFMPDEEGLALGRVAGFVT
jgi:hypothetical protein